MTDILKAGGVIAKIREPLVKYRIHSGQITSTSEIEQKAYQCRISFDYINREFPELSELECAAISLLGFNKSWRELLETIQSDGKMFKACGYLLQYHNELERPRVFVGAIKKVVWANGIKKVYNQEKLEMILRGFWWKKVVRMSKELKKPWGMGLYTMVSFSASRSCIGRFC